MIGHLVEISEDDRHLSVFRGFLRVEHGGEELGRVALDDISAVIANAHGLTYSNNLLVKLAERGIPMVLSGANHLPVAVVWPVDGHHLQSARMLAQAGAPKPLCKRLWKQLIQAKIRNQGAVLASLGQPAGGFDLLARQVRSGDPENVEAQAARRYWPLLMGDDFLRDRDRGGVNALLNYGYAVLRATVARGVMAAGLHPTLGVHHRNRGNPMCLVDDAMEPFRPLVDLRVHRLTFAGTDSVTTDVKRSLVSLMSSDMETSEGTSPLSTCIARLTQSLARSFETGNADLVFPDRPLPLALGAT